MDFKWIDHGMDLSTIILLKIKKVLTIDSKKRVAKVGCIEHQMSLYVSFFKQKYLFFTFCFSVSVN